MRLNWQLNAGVLSPEVCDEIIHFCKSTCNMYQAQTYNGQSDLRKTNVGWVTDSKIVSIVQDYALAANRNAFNLAVDYLPPVQFGEYGPGGHYDWHHDINWENGSMYDRKLSIVIQLSDPTSYQGGEFQFREVETPLAFKQRGSILVFPSYLMHRVTPIDNGVRYSLVGWMEGPRWR